MCSILSHLLCYLFMLLIFHVLPFCPGTYTMAPQMHMFTLHASMLTNAALMSIHDCANADANI